MKNRVIYFDNNATTMVDPAVFKAIEPFFCERYGNASSIHTFGGSVGSELTRAREQVAGLLGSNYRNNRGESSEIIFTSCGTESDNAAIWSALLSNPERRKVVTTRVEHPAILSLMRELERRGYTVELVGVNPDGSLDMAALEKAIDQHTAIVSCMWANNETGTIFPVAEIARMAHAKGALFHTDAVQAAGKVPLNLNDTEIDFASFSGHKLHAPKGVGVLYVRRGTSFRPFLVGGHQEMGRRAGTENVTGIIGLGVACEVAAAKLEEEITHTKTLRDYLEQEVTRLIPSIRINGDLQNRLPNTSSISFEYIEGESILMLLDQFGICASSGSACTTGSLEPSHVLRAMQLPYTAAHGTVRFSFSRFNTRDEVDRLLEVLPDIISSLRRLSPYWDEQKGSVK